MKLYGGIDLHSNNCVVVLLDEEDPVVYEKRLANDLGYLLLELAPYQGMIEGGICRKITFPIYELLLYCPSW
jgi:transposase